MRGSGTGFDEVSAWHLVRGVWGQVMPSLLTYDGNGVVSFTVDSFSGYAVAVPEPTMVGVGIVGIFAHAKARKEIEVRLTLSVLTPCRG